MTRTYIDKGTGKHIDINVAGNTYLGKITIGLWDKIGFAPKTEEDCKIVARIIRNHIHYQQWKDYPSPPELSLIEFLEPDEIEDMKNIADFFENAKGIRED